MKNSENLENSNNQNLREKNRVIFDEMAGVNYDIPKSKQILLNIKRLFKDWFIVVSLYFGAIMCIINYFDYPSEVNLSEAKTHIGKVADIEIPMPKFSRVPYHNSNSCFIHFENLDGTREKLAAKNCNLNIIPKIWKAKEIKIYETPIFHLHFIYQLKRYDDAILYAMTKSELMEISSDKILLLRWGIITFLFAMYLTIKLKNKEK